jgi:hypothetical protein
MPDRQPGHRAPRRDPPDAAGALARMRPPRLRVARARTERGHGQPARRRCPTMSGASRRTPSTPRSARQSRANVSEQEVEPEFARQGLHAVDQHTRASSNCCSSPIAIASSVRARTCRSCIATPLRRYSSASDGLAASRAAARARPMRSSASPSSGSRSTTSRY